ncbi:MAG TPA: GNAT family protein [Nocardioidaceae bacterium]|nr:GNAT family protein [Nocardioidaceae bacterium]
MVLRPLRRRDRADWQRLRATNRDWLQEWDATMPPSGPPWGPTSGAPDEAARGYPAMVRELRALARAGRCLPFAVLYERRMVGQLTVSNIVWGSARWGQVGYWIDQGHAGRGIMTTAVALAIDHCFFGMGLHRIEVAIRPENTASLRVVEKLRIGEIGLAPRYLHISGAWRSHRLFAITVEEVPRGLLARLTDT